MKEELEQDIMLFEQEEIKPQIQSFKTCKKCKHRYINRVRVYKGELCISYCLKNYSKRTESGYLKIKAMQKACYMYEE